MNADDGKYSEEQLKSFVLLSALCGKKLLQVFMFFLIYGEMGRI